MDLLAKLKLLLGITTTDKDTLLLLILENSTAEALDYCHLSSASGLDSIILEMAVYNYNRLGTQGLNSESYSGVSYNYSSNYPTNIIRHLQAHRVIRTVE